MENTVQQATCNILFVKVYAYKIENTFFCEVKYVWKKC